MKMNGMKKVFSSTSVWIKDLVNIFILKNEHYYNSIHQLVFEALILII